ncbi:MAG: GNAT family N-acetyltransferase, partial [Pseudomonadota bacterium]
HTASRSTSEGAFTLRPATSADLPALEVLEVEGFAGDRLSRRSFRRLLARPSAQLMVAEAGGPVGYALTLFRRGSGAARLYSLAVARAWRGRGVGRALIRDAADTARRRGCGRLDLEVRADNATAQALYRDLGFVAVRDLPGYYADGAAGTRLSLALEPSP